MAKASLKSLSEAGKAFDEAYNVPVESTNLEGFEVNMTIL